jgi:hypothetical protein
VIRSFLVSAAVAATASGQNTWTVGTSGQFATIQAAVQAASDGDLILVQPTGTYLLNFTLTKGVAIVGSGATRTRVQGGLTVTGVGGGRQVVLSNLGSDGAALGRLFYITVTQCAGNVLCENVELWGQEFTGFGVAPHTTLGITNSALVALHRSSVRGWPGISALGSAVTCSDTTITGVGADPFYGIPAPAEAIRATGCRVALSGCTLRGGSANIRVASSGEQGFRCTSGSILAANTRFEGGMGSGPFSSAVGLGLYTNSVLVHDPTCVYPTGSTNDGTGVVIVHEMCRITGQAAAPGNVASFATAGPAGGVAALFVALPAPPTTLPFGDVWLHLPTTSMLQIGPLPLPVASLAIPSAVLRGTAITLQTGLLFQGIVQMSPPLVTSVP